MSFGLALERCLAAGIGSPGELELNLVFCDRIQLGLVSEFKVGPLMIAAAFGEVSLSSLCFLMISTQ
jgi:hypothetical protein